MQANLLVGPHLLGRGDPDATNWIRGKPAAAVLADVGIPGEFAPGDCFWVGRKTEDEFDPNNPAGGGFSTDPTLAAQQYIARYLHDTITLEPGIPAWESSNEPTIETPERMTWLALFSAEFCRVIREKYNRIPVIGNWAVANPKVELNLWPYYKPALEAVKRYGGVLGRHSYGPLNEIYALRHRYDNRIFSALGFRDLPVIITECGYENLPEVPQWAWRTEGHELSENDYAGYFAALDTELRRDSYVMGATAFTYGLGWKQHSLNESSVGAKVVAATQGRPPITLQEPRPMTTQTRVRVIPNEKYKKWNLRPGPGYEHTPRAAAWPGTEFPVLATTGEWYQVTPVGFDAENSPALWIHKSATAAV